MKATTILLFGVTVLTTVVMESYAAPFFSSPVLFLFTNGFERECGFPKRDVETAGTDCEEENVAGELEIIKKNIYSSMDDSVAAITNFIQNEDYASANSVDSNKEIAIKLQNFFKQLLDTANKYDQGTKNDLERGNPKKLRKTVDELNEVIKTIEAEGAKIIGHDKIPSVLQCAKGNAKEALEKVLARTKYENEMILKFAKAIETQHSSGKKNVANNLASIKKDIYDSMDESGEIISNFIKYVDYALANSADSNNEDLTKLSDFFKQLLDTANKYDQGTKNDLESGNPKKLHKTVNELNKVIKTIEAKGAKVIGNYKKLSVSQCAKANAKEVLDKVLARTRYENEKILKYATAIEAQHSSGNNNVANDLENIKKDIYDSMDKSGNLISNFIKYGDYDLASSADSDNEDLTKLTNFFKQLLDTANKYDQGTKNDLERGNPKKLRKTVDELNEVIKTIEAEGAKIIENDKKQYDSQCAKTNAKKILQRVVGNTRYEIDNILKYAQILETQYSSAEENLTSDLENIKKDIYNSMDDSVKTIYNFIQYGDNALANSAYSDREALTKVQDFFKQLLDTANKFDQGTKTDLKNENPEKLRKTVDALNKVIKSIEEQGAKVIEYVKNKPGLQCAKANAEGAIKTVLSNSKAESEKILEFAKVLES